MIIGYNKTTGKIIGAVEGRIHNAQQKSMSFDSSEDPGNFDKIIVEWRPVIDPETKNHTGDYEPDVPEEEQALWRDLDQYPHHVYLYVVDINTKKLKGKNSL